MTKPQNKSTQFNIRLSPAEVSNLAAAASTLGVSKSDLVRLLLRLQCRFHPLAAPKDTPSFIILDTSAIRDLARDNLRQGQALGALERAVSNLSFNRREVNAAELNSFKREVAQLRRSYDTLFLAIQALRASAKDYL